MKKETGILEHSSHELKKHVAMIHSNSNISLLQRKISNALLFHAYENLNTQDEHEIHISALTRLIGYDSHDHKRVKQSLMDLLATVVEWNIVDGNKIDKEGVWNASSIIADVSIDGSTCTYSYSNKMRKLLYHPSVYGRLNMQVQAKFQSSYGLALYENCNRYQDIGQTPWFELEKFRKLMGVDSDKYKIFRDFKVRVLSKSVEEVNKYSALMVEPKLKKQNRQVVAIQFLIKRREIVDAEMVSTSSPEALDNILKQRYGLSQKQINEVVSKFEEKYIKEKIVLVESSTSFVKGTIKNMGKYLLCALTDDYQPVKNSAINREKKQKASSDTTEQYYRYARNIALTELETLDKVNKDQYLSAFEKYMEKNIYKQFYRKEGLKNILVQDQFVKFILSSQNEISKNIKPKEVWQIG